MKTDTELRDLRVPHSYDKFSATRQVFALIDHLQLTPAQCHNLYREFRREYSKYRKLNKNSGKMFRKDFLFVIRWMCRGLTFEESFRKWEIENDEGAAFIARKRNYGKGRQKRR